MAHKGLAAAAILALANFAFAGAEVQLTTQHLGGSSFLVEMWVNPTNLPGGGESLLLRSAQVNYSATPGLMLGTDIDARGAGLDGIANFWFDYSGLPGGGYPAGSGGANQLARAGGGATGAYIDFSNLAAGTPRQPVAPSTIYVGSPGGSLISLPAVQSPGAPIFTRLGGMMVTLPTTPGTYTLDLLSVGAGNDFNEATTLTFGFGGSASSDPFTIWSTATGDPRVSGEIAYADGAGPASFTVVPEPTTLLLALLATAVLARRRHVA